MTNGANRPTKKDKQSAARERARLMREAEQKKAKRRRWIVQGSVGVAILAVVAIVALVIVNSAQPTSAAGPRNMLSDGIVLTSSTTAQTTAGIPDKGKPTNTTPADDGKAHIVTYIDYQCPYCDQFETANETQIGQWLDEGAATLEVHPIAILDRSSNGNRYSSRAANAAACVAQYEPSKFFAVNSAFYADQPAEGSNGRTDKQILATMKKAGVDDADVTSCVDKETFKGWVTAETARALKGPIPNSSLSAVSSTPTVIVNGQQYNGDITDASAFASFVDQAVTAAGSSSTPTPAPTPSN